MSPKRTFNEADLIPLSTQRLDLKRTRLSPSAGARSDVSDRSTVTSASVVSALRSSPTSSERTIHTNASSVSDSESDDTSESSILNSSSEESEESEEDEDDEEDDGFQGQDVVQHSSPRITLGGPRKPQIGNVDPQRLMEEKDNLLRRLREFMPKLQKANQELEGQGATTNMEVVGEGEPHIEMNLGLGVLEENNAEDSNEDSGQEQGSSESDAVQKLLDIQSKPSRPTIEDLEERENAHPLATK